MLETESHEPVPKQGDLEEQLTQEEQLLWSRAEAVLGPLYDPNHLWLGHATNPDTIADIFEQGLKMRADDLSSTSIPLNHHGVPLAEQPAEAKRVFIKPSQHHGYTDMVIIDMNVPDDGKPHRPEGALQHVGDPGQGFPGVVGDSDHYLLPREYILGSWNSEQAEFIPNPHYQVLDMPERLTPAKVDPLFVAHGESDEALQVPSFSEDYDLADDDGPAVW